MNPITIENAAGGAFVHTLPVPEQHAAATDDAWAAFDTNQGGELVGEGLGHIAEVSAPPSPRRVAA